MPFDVRRSTFDVRRPMPQRIIKTLMSFHADP